MATRVHVQNNRSRVLNVRTEFCIRASKLDLGNSTPKNPTESSNKSNSSLFSTDNGAYEDTKVVPRDPSSLRSAASTADFRRLESRNIHNSGSLGVMGTKYFKKPKEFLPKEATKNKPSIVSPRNLSEQENNPIKVKARKTSSGLSFVPTAFGFRQSRTDTFSGISRSRPSRKNKLRADIAEGARKHIVACHIVQTAKRGCPAIQSYHSLRDCVSPTTKSSKVPAHGSTDLPYYSSESLNKPQCYKFTASKASLTASLTSLAEPQLTQLPEVVGKVFKNAPKVSRETNAGLGL